MFSRYQKFSKMFLNSKYICPESHVAFCCKTLTIASFIRQRNQENNRDAIHCALWESYL